MRIAVTYDEGNIFQHFGHTERFKLYDVEADQVITTRILSTNGSGHGMLAGILNQQQVDVLICGGIGPGAQNALAECGIILVPGAFGDADTAVEKYLKGELLPGAANCDHHGEGHNCGHGEGHSCHHAEGSCGEHCGAHGGNNGKQCSVHYRGTFNDGTQFDSSYDRGEPLTFVCGAGMMIPGFDAAVATMQVGEKRTIHLMPNEAYGEKDPRAIFTVDVHQMPGAEALSVGQQVYLSTPDGQPVPVTVTAREGDMITFDANHEMAGKELNFEIELVEVKA